MRKHSAANASRQLLIQDPYHDYAARLIEIGLRKYGLRTICFYTDPRERARQQRRFPVLRSPAVTASYEVAPSAFGAFAAHLKRRHRVAAVVPFNEPGVRPAARLAHDLGLSWAQPQVIERIADKFALKEYLRRQHPDLRINASRRVASAADVSSARARPEFARFVLKPAAGFGNRDIGIFGPETSGRTVAEFLDRMAGAPVVMEQYVGGTEYFVNGQVDANGEILVVAIFRYVRVAANGRDNIDFETLLVPRAEPCFDELAGYAAAVVRATGLRRSPFHLELKRDDDGPCLIEVGARLAGLGNAALCGDLHGSRLDLFDLALHYYLSDAAYGPAPLDWAAYDAAAVRYVHGIANRREYVHRIDGIDAVEAMPEFHSWVKRPVLGMRIEPTLDILTMPYSLILRGRSEADLAASAERVRELLRFNGPATLARRARVGLETRARRYAVAVWVRIASSWRALLARHRFAGADA